MSSKKWALTIVNVATVVFLTVSPWRLSFAADEEGYEPVQPGEFKLGLAVASLEFSNGGKCVASGKGIELRLNEYLLKVTGVSNCKIDTEELGPVKLIPTGPFGAQLWLTPAQKTKAKMLK